jgi:hypothetical protein
MLNNIEFQVISDKPKNSTNHYIIKFVNNDHREACLRFLKEEMSFLNFTRIQEFLAIHVILNDNELIKIETALKLASIPHRFTIIPT